MPRGSGSDEIRLSDASLRDISLLAKHLKATEPEMRKELMKRMRGALRPAVDAVKAEAAFSSRIPGAVTGRVNYAAKGVVAKVVVNAGKAPHAKAINNRGRAGVFRHPVFGHRDVWVSQKANPFIERGGRRAVPAVEREMTKVYDDVSRRAGFK